jgi:hypothetical protein
VDSAGQCVVFLKRKPLLHDLTAGGVLALNFLRLRVHHRPLPGKSPLFRGKHKGGRLAGDAEHSLENAAALVEHE